jgi:CRISPR/Cas system-associated endoribonuclease Cas2
MSTKAAKKIADLRKTDFKQWHFSLWLLKRRLLSQVAHYSVVNVDVDKKLQAKLKHAVTSRIDTRNLKLMPYDFLTDDQDDRVLTLELEETDFNKIQAEVDKGTANKKAEKFEDLLDAWAYVVKLENDSSSIYGVRKISQYTRAAKLAASGTTSFFLFRDKQLTDIEDEKIFTFDTRIDFFAHDGMIFIANKRDFESVMNFRVGMEKNRDSVLEDIAALNVFSDVNTISKHVGSNLNLLRKLSAIQKSGYYKDPAFLKKLITLNQQKGWGLKVENGVIVVDDESVNLVLKLLNNDRLESPINLEVFDASVKRKVV